MRASFLFIINIMCPKSKPKKRKEEFGLSLKSYWPMATHHPQLLSMKEASDKKTQRLRVTWNYHLHTSKSKFQIHGLVLIESKSLVAFLHLLQFLATLCDQRKTNYQTYYWWSWKAHGFSRITMDLIKRFIFRPFAYTFNWYHL